MKKNIRRGLLILWIVIIFVLMGFPMLEVPKVKNFPIDKFYHFIVFFVMAFLAARALGARDYYVLGTAVIILAELQQLVVPGRDFEFLDMAAGFVALVAGYFIFRERRLAADVSEA